MNLVTHCKHESHDHVSEKVQASAEGGTRFPSGALEVLPPGELEELRVSTHRDPSGELALEKLLGFTTPHRARQAVVNVHRAQLRPRLTEGDVPVEALLTVLVEMESHVRLADALIAIKESGDARSAVVDWS